MPVALPPPGARPFADIVRGCPSAGFLSLYQKEEKVWIELRPDQFDRPLFMSVNMPNGIGERGIYGSQMGASQVVVFHRVGNLVQMIAKNTGYGAKGGTPQALAVQQAFRTACWRLRRWSAARIRRWRSWWRPMRCCSATWR
jgi:hypothetical protein